MEKEKIMECYLDNSATTKVDPDVAELIQKVMTEDYGNPASLHRKGFEAEQHIRKAKKTLSDILKCKESELIFTSGGTESDNLALIGSYFANMRSGNHVVTTRIEHPAVLRTVEYLGTIGAKVDFIDVDSKGHIDTDQLEDAVGDKTAIVSVMHVNNEIGALQPVSDIGRMVHEKNPKCVFHVDDVQGFGKLSLIPKDSNIDLLSVSAHKLHGPKGVGLLFRSEKVKLSPLMHGGGHQGGYRSGTENVPGVAGFALAASKLYEDLEGSYERMTKLKKIFMEGLSETDGVVLNGGDVPYIISLSIRDVRAEVLLHALEEKGVYISSGSACSSNKVRASETLKAMCAETWQLDSTVRISLSSHTTEDEIRYASDQLRTLIPQLRKFVRK